MKIYWCNTHEREARDEHGCDPRLGGITLPCRVVKLTDIEITKNYETLNMAGFSPRAKFEDPTSDRPPDQKP